MFEVDAEKINHSKLVSCYLTKKGIRFDNREKFDCMTYEQLEDLITNDYDIKGDINWKSLQSAKKITDCPLEKDEQKNFCNWLKKNKIAFYANGLGIDFNNNYKYLNSLRSQGWKTNIPDLTILLGNGKTVFVEMKRIKGGRVTEGQEKCINWLNTNGYPSKVCKGCNEAIEFIESMR